MVQDQGSEVMRELINISLEKMSSSISERSVSIKFLLNVLLCGGSVQKSGIRYGASSTAPSRKEYSISLNYSQVIKYIFISVNRYLHLLPLKVH